jgi:hypothetical protein
VPTHAYTIKTGTRGKTLLVHARPGNEGASGLTGLSAATPGARAAYVREGEAGAHSIDLVPGTVGVWNHGGFVEVDPDALPGVYQFGAPDEMLAPGSPRVLLLLGFPGAAIDPIDIDLVAFDPQDGVRLGMTALSPEARVQALRGAFPRLAAKEIEERTALQNVPD